MKRHASCACANTFVLRKKKLFQMRKEKNNYVKQNTHNRTNEINKN